ncbi:MAG: flagellar filament capping protein FliD [Planctomycetes bacterium]|nr:flagellar filament capping protein FliD [Planctomycetota bacterium]
MSTAGISFGGLASGLDTKAIISALVALEERPIRAMETKKASYTKQKSMFSDLRGLLDKLSTSAKALKTSTDFLKMKAASSDEEVLTASASTSATPGTYTVTVNSLAKAQVKASTGSSSATAVVGTGELVINVKGLDHVITPGGDNLTDIATAINAYDDANEIGVRAEVVDTGNTANGGAQRYQLVVRATEPGTENAFTISGDAGLATLMSQIQGNTITAATDTSLTVNGINVTRSTNQVADVFPGITLDLKKAGTATITVSTDSEEIGKKVQEFVDAYNKVVDFFTDQNALDAEGKAKSPLFGDSTLRSMRGALRTVLGGAVDTSGNPAYQMLSQLGIKSDTAGKLTFDKTKFDEALAADEDAVAAVFTDATKGIAVKMFDQLDLYTDSVEGLLKSRSDTFDRQVKDTQSRIDQAERRLTLYEKQLEAKYANLESLLSRLQSQGSSVNSIGR